MKGLGLVNNQSGRLFLTEAGKSFFKNPTKIQLANIINDKVRLFGEVLNTIESHPMTVEETNDKICKEYKLNWKDLSSIRRRMDWLEVLGLIQGIANRKWEVTIDGKKVLNDWNIILPNDIESVDIELNEIKISQPPKEISLLLQTLYDNPELHKKRNTYNIWAPSPNRIENLRIIMQAAMEKINKKDLFNFICEEFKLKLSSVESMFPFLKAAGFIEEVGRNVYMTTEAAKEWIETDDDLDFIRILHSHMQFVGEMIKAAETNIVRNDLYAKAIPYGLNTEKARWIAGFLLEAGLLEEPQYLHLKATSLGKKFAYSLPLYEINQNEIYEQNDKEEKTNLVNKDIELLFQRLDNASKNPSAEGKGLGVAFEEAIAEIFNFIGFDAKRIGGAGDTDVLVHWKDKNNKTMTAIIDGKSKSNGHVTHSDISDIAIDTHKEKNNADYVAIVGANFNGETIINHAKKKEIALITTNQLIDIAKSTNNLGLSLQEISMIFQTPNGISKLYKFISQKQRQLDIISYVISIFYKKQEQIGALSPRDLFLLLMTTDISPSLNELINIFDILSNPEIAVLHAVDKNRFPEEYTMYILDGAKEAVFRLRAIATSIEKGLND